MQLLGKYRGEQDVRATVLNLAAERNQIIYGQRSVNVNLPVPLRRKTKDYDILTKKPKQMAEELVKRLNKEFGEGSFRVEPAKYKKTFKVKSKSGETIADYTQTTKKPKVKNVFGVKYANLGYQERKIRKILKDEASKFRYEKDLDTLERIRKGRKRIW